MVQRCTKYAAVAHLVERHLAKVEVASSSLVGRSNTKPSFVQRCTTMAFLCQEMLTVSGLGRILKSSCSKQRRAGPACGCSARRGRLASVRCVEAVFMSIAHCLSGLFVRIIRCTLLYENNFLQEKEGNQ